LSLPSELFKDLNGNPSPFTWATVSIVTSDAGPHEIVAAVAGKRIVVAFVFFGLQSTDRAPQLEANSVNIGPQMSNEAVVRSFDFTSAPIYTTAGHALDVSSNASAGAVNISVAYAVVD